MDPIIGGLITGGANLLSGIFGSQTSAQNTQMQIAASEQEQATQNAFTEQMSNTAYQRADADMKAAGLNPAMMFGSGSAASTPSGSSIQAPMPQNTSPMQGLGKAAESVVSTAVQSKTFDKMTEEIANLRAQEARTSAETATERERPELVKQQVNVEKERALNIAQNSAKMGNEMPVSRLAGKSAEAIETLPPWLRDNAIRAGWLGGKADDLIAPFANSAKSILPWVPKSGRSSKEFIDPRGNVSSFDERWADRVGR